MTHEYIAGELSLRLGDLQAVATDQERAREAARLRQEAERMPLVALGSVVVRALGLADRLCWDARVWRRLGLQPSGSDLR